MCTSPQDELRMGRSFRHLCCSRAAIGSQSFFARSRVGGLAPLEIVILSSFDGKNFGTRCRLLPKRRSLDISAISADCFTGGCQLGSKPYFPSPAPPACLPAPRLEVAYAKLLPGTLSPCPC